MAGSTIGTPALGSAQDKTEQALQQLKQKVQALEGSAAQASKRMDSPASQDRQITSANVAVFLRASPMIDRVAGTAARFSASSLKNIARIAKKFTLEAAQAGITVAAQAVITETARQSHEFLLMDNAGATPADKAIAKDKAWGLARKYKPIAPPDMMHMLNGIRPFVVSYEEAARIADPLAQLRVIWQGVNPEASDKEINDTFDKLIHTAATGRFTKDARRFTALTDNIARAVNVYGRLAKPDEMFAAARSAGPASDNWSAEFVAGVLPGLILSAGGAEEAGKALGAIDQVARGEFDSNAEKQMRALHLLKNERVAGKRVTVPVDADRARSDPDQWINGTLAPALARNKVTGRARIKVLERLFGERNAQFIDDRLTQDDVYKDMRANAHRAKARGAATEFMRKDVEQSLKGLKNKLKSDAADLAQPGLPPILDSINAVQGWLGDANASSPARPPAALTNPFGKLIGIPLREAARAGLDDMVKDRKQTGLRPRAYFGLGRRGQDKTWNDGWALGVTEDLLAPGLLSFGFGEAGVNPRAAAGETYSAGPGALRFSPRRGAVQRRGRFSDVVPSLRNASRQGMAVTVTAEPIRIESSVRVEASSELVRAAASVKTATRVAKLSTRASGPGSTGSTEFGNQH